MKKSYKKKVEDHIHWGKLQDKHRAQGFWVGFVLGLATGFYLSLLLIFPYIK